MNHILLSYCFKSLLCLSEEVGTHSFEEFLFLCDPDRNLFKLGAEFRIITEKHCDPVRKKGWIVTFT